MDITGYSVSVSLTAQVAYLGEGIDVSWTTEEGWQIDQTIDHYGWEEWQIDTCFELLDELPTPCVTL